MSNLDKTKTGLGRGLGSLLGTDVGDNFLNAEEKGEAPAPVVVKEIEKPEIKMSSATRDLDFVEASTEKAAETISDESRIWQVDIEKLKPNSFQPRTQFDKEKVKELAESIKEQGVLQPIVARKNKYGNFEIIAGERRWRASQVAGLHKVPVILKNVDDQKSLELALIENIQRENLNPIEEAEAYDQLAIEFDLSQQEIATKVGKERSTVTNILRLLSLTPEVKNMLSSGELSAGHAKALLAITDPQKQREIAKRIASEKLTVRAAEKIVKNKAEKGDSAMDLNVTERLVRGLSDDLQRALGTKVKIDYKNSKGRVSIFFYSDDELTDLSERLKGPWN